MLDIERQITRLKIGAAEDWEVACDLVNQGKVRHGLFFTHLTLEKILKAVISKKIQQLAPRIHNLIRLAELTSLELDQKVIDLLSEINVFNIEGRYPESFIPHPSIKEAKDYIVRAEEVYQWLINQL